MRRLKLSILEVDGEEFDTPVEYTPIFGELEQMPPELVDFDLVVPVNRQMVVVQQLMIENSLTIEGRVAVL